LADIARYQIYLCRQFLIGGTFHRDDFHIVAF
jgi:hypothetical protein